MKQDLSRNECLSWPGRLENFPNNFQKIQGAKVGHVKQELSGSQFSAIDLCPVSDPLFNLIDNYIVSINMFSGSSTY